MNQHMLLGKPDRTGRTHDAPDYSSVVDHAGVPIARRQPMHILGCTLAQISSARVARLLAELLNIPDVDLFLGFPVLAGFSSGYRRALWRFSRGASCSGIWVQGCKADAIAIHDRGW